MARNTLMVRYHAQKSDATRRGIPWLFTFETWMAVWRKSRKLPMRGNRVGQYCMTRPGDRGPYSPENVRIRRIDKNVKEKGWSATARAKISAAHTGRIFSEETRARMRVAALARHAARLG
jgi:hypothetical protein